MWGSRDKPSANMPQCTSKGSHQGWKICPMPPCTTTAPRETWQTQCGRINLRDASKRRKQLAEEALPGCTHLGERCFESLWVVDSFSCILEWTKQKYPEGWWCRNRTDTTSRAVLKTSSHTSGSHLLLACMEMQVYLLPPEGAIAVPRLWSENRSRSMLPIYCSWCI